MSIPSLQLYMCASAALLVCSSGGGIIMEYLVKISKKARILELKRRHLKKLTLTSYTPYPSRKIRRICACTSQKTTKDSRSIRREIGEQSVHVWMVVSNYGKSCNFKRENKTGRVQNGGLKMAKNINISFVLQAMLEVLIKLLGKLWVLLEIESSKANEQFRKNAVRVVVFRSTSLPMTSGGTDENTLGWKCGIPFKLWTIKSFSRIASKWAAP
ncbi:hypothetical protein Tco_0381851 [Tanacetum coccineum]